MTVVADGHSLSKRQSRCDCDSRAFPRLSQVWSARLGCCRRIRCCSSARAACLRTTAFSVPPPRECCCARSCSARLGPAEMRSLRGSGNGNLSVSICSTYSSFTTRLGDTPLDQIPFRGLRLILSIYTLIF